MSIMWTPNSCMHMNSEWPCMDLYLSVSVDSKPNMSSKTSLFYNIRQNWGVNSFRTHDGTKHTYVFWSDAKGEPVQLITIRVDEMWIKKCLNQWYLSIVVLSLLTGCKQNGDVINMQNMLTKSSIAFTIHTYIYAGQLTLLLKAVIGCSVHFHHKWPSIYRMQFCSVISLIHVLISHIICSRC